MRRRSLPFPDIPTTKFHFKNLLISSEHIQNWRDWFSFVCQTLFFFSLANFLSYLCVELSKWGIFYINQEKIKRRRRKGQCTNKCTEKIAEVLLILSNIPFYYNSTYALRSMNHFYYGNLNSIWLKIWFLEL